MVLQALAGMIPATITMDVAMAMRATEPETSLTDDQLRRDGAFVVEERHVPGPVGASDVSLLICRPSNSGGNAPGIYYIHGGGMVIGNNRGGMDQALDWAQATGAVVCSVEYRLAPEHPHPAPVDDCYAGLLGMVALASELGIDTQNIIIAGHSAGGGLAAGTALLARDLNGPTIAGQLLVYPMLDDRFITQSSRELHGVGIWDYTSNVTGWTALLGDSRGTASVSEYAAPARAESLEGLPPTYIDVGAVETFRDEVLTYATRLLQAGIDTEAHVWPGAFHGFEIFAPEATVSRRARGARIEWIKRASSKHPGAHA